MKHGKKAIWAGAGTLAGLILAWLFFAPVAPVSFVAPVPNGYSDFIRASALVGGEFPPARQWTNTPDQAAVRRWMSQQGEAFSLVSEGLKKQCRVPILISTNYVGWHQVELGNLKHLTHCLVARAELARYEGRTNDALAAYLEAYRFAHELSRGGLVIDYLIELSCEALVIQSFKPFVPDLSSEQRAEALKVITAVEQDQEPPGAVMARLRSWQQATFDPSTRMRGRLALWWTAVKRSWAEGSLTPFDVPLGRILKRGQLAHQKAVDNLCGLLRGPSQGLSRPNHHSEQTNTLSRGTTAEGDLPHHEPVW